MDSLIHSKHLYVKNKADNFIITHELTSTSINASNDIINLLNFFKTPRNLMLIDNDSFINRKDSITLLKSNKFLVSTEDYETSYIFSQWKNLFNKPLYSYTEDNLLTINYFTHHIKTTDVLVKELYKICLNMHTSILPFIEPISVYFLTKTEFIELSKKFNIPSGACGFVYAKTLLVLDYETFFIKENSRMFFPTVRHEALHILLGQHRYTLPFWIEEGLCELYSFRSDTKYINNYLKNSSSIDFYDLYEKRVRHVNELSVNNLLQTNLYPQFQSFTSFILNKLGEKNFWNMLKNTSIYEDFGELLSTHGNLSLKEENENWRSFINFNS